MESSKRAQSLILLFVFFVFFFFYYFNAYLCDDAFIIFRVLDHFVRGFGLRWNTMERVQVFTCPLYTLLLAPFYYLIYDRSALPNPTRVWGFVMATSFIFSFSTILLLWRRFQDRSVFFAVFALLLSSQAFVTFTSSGLETPLSYFLLAYFMMRYLALNLSTLNQRDAFLLFLTAGLAVCNRLDLAVILLPACLHLVWVLFYKQKLRSVPLLFASATPLIFWFIFSLVYFGFLLPNTYYAKIGFPVEQTILWKMGMQYLSNSFHEDPITLCLIVLVTSVSCFRISTFLAQLGSLFYVLYITMIGGDFLGFRFLAMSYLVSVLVIGHYLHQKKSLTILQKMSGGLVALCILYSLLTPFSPLRVYVDGPTAADVKYYYFASALRYYRPGRLFPFSTFHAVRDSAYCQSCRASSYQVHVTGGGIRGFCRGPLDQLIEPQRITDPLLARLPGPKDQTFLPGHYDQPIPAGYVESIEWNQNLIADPDLAPYYKNLRLIVSGDLFSTERWRNIFQFNFTRLRRYEKSYLIADPPYEYDIR